MAVALEFIDFIVPISVIERKYPGGWKRCLEDHAAALGRRVWHDGHLFRDGAMNPQDMGKLVEHWASLGFQPMTKKDGQMVWLDCCVVEGMFGGATMPCDWIEVAEDGRSAWLKGEGQGQIVGRDEELCDE